MPKEKKEMNIQIKNTTWIDIEENDDGQYYTISAVGENGNTVEIHSISKKYLMELSAKIVRLR